MFSAESKTILHGFILGTLSDWNIKYFNLQREGYRDLYRLKIFVFKADSLCNSVTMFE